MQLPVSVYMHKSKLSLCYLNAYIAFTGLVGEFCILDENTSTQEMPYDYKSVMHLGTHVFTKGRDKTIVPLKAIGHLSIGPYPTTLDIIHINMLYCQGKCNAYNDLYMYM